MMKKFLFVFTIFIINASADFVYEPFDSSMAMTSQSADQNINILYSFLKEQYEKRNPSITKCNQNSIPKIIHQIWIGPRPIPDKYKKLTESWKQKFPDWQYKLWTNNEVEEFKFKEKDLFNLASSYQEKSDILRYAILREYGGLYVDMDYEAINNFGDILSKYDFIGSIEPTHANNIAISNAIIASKPKNPLFEKLLKVIRKNWHSVEKSFIDEVGKNKLQENLIHLAVNRTMTPLKQSSIDYLKINKCAIILPPTYLSIESRDKFFDKLKNFFGIKSKRLYFRTIQPETLARQLRGGKRQVDNLRDF